MPTLLHKPRKIEITEAVLSVRSDWRQGIQHRGYRGETNVRGFRLTFEDQTKSQWDQLVALYESAGCGAGEITWPDAPGGSIVVLMPTMPAVAQSGQRYQITVELEELLSTDT